MTTPMDYNQQLYAYLQALRQLLEPLTTLVAAMPYPGSPPMPPMSPAPPASLPTVLPVPTVPTDYNQQLFTYLQSWRQYLEQVAGSRPGQVQPTATHRVWGEDAPAARPPWPPAVPVPPEDPYIGRGPAPNTVSRDGPSPTQWPSARVDLGPQNPGNSQVPDDLDAIAMQPTRIGQAAVAARGPLRDIRPALEIPQYRGTSFNRAAGTTARVAPSAPIQAARQSLYRDRSSSR